MRKSDDDDDDHEMIITAKGRQPPSLTQSFIRLEIHFH